MYSRVLLFFLRIYIYTYAVLHTGGREILVLAVSGGEHESARGGGAAAARLGSCRVGQGRGKRRPELPTASSRDLALRALPVGELFAN